MEYYWLAIAATILIGIAKAGFGGGVGIAAVPMFILACGDTREALAIMLPIMVVCDLFSLWHYRHTFDKPNIYHLMPGVLLGIVVGSFLLDRVEEEQLKFWIGVIAILFVIYQVTKEKLLNITKAYKPLSWHGWAFGLTIGVTSTLAHAAGPPATMYLLPQQMGRRLFVGTSVVLFTLVNAIKLIPYFLLGMITFSRLGTSATLMLVIPIGTFLGVWMNKKMNETVFNIIIYIILILMGLKFTINFDPIGMLLGVNQM